MIEFVEENHEYKVDGVVKPSVTQILKDLGITEDYGDLSPFYANRGTAVHHFCTILAQGFLDWDTVADDAQSFLAQFGGDVTWEDCLPYVRTFQGLMFALGLEYVSSEVACYNEELGYCGKYDLIMMWEGKRTLVELKTGEVHPWVDLQVAGYKRLVEVDTSLVISLKEGKVYTEGKLYHESDKAFLDVVAVYKWKHNRKRRKMVRLI